MVRAVVRHQALDRERESIVENRFQMLGCAMLVAGLCIAASLLSPGMPDYTSVEATATLGALGVSLALSAVWRGLRPADAVVPLLSHKTPAEPRDGV